MRVPTKYVWVLVELEKIASKSKDPRAPELLKWCHKQFRLRANTKRYRDTKITPEIMRATYEYLTNVPKTSFDISQEIFEDTRVFYPPILIAFAIKKINYDPKFNIKIIKEPGSHLNKYYIEK